MHTVAPEGVAWKRSQAACASTPRRSTRSSTRNAPASSRCYVRLADRLEAAPLSRLSAGLAWVAGGVEVLVRAVERALGRDQKG